MRNLSNIEDLTHGYNTDLTDKMFANRDKIELSKDEKAKLETINKSPGRRPALHWL